MKFEFERTQVELKIYGQEISISMPTEEQVMTMQEELQEVQDDSRKVLSVRRKFLIGLGVPEDVLSKMEFVHVNKLAEGLMGEIGKKS